VPLRFRLRKSFLTLGIVLLILGFFFFYWASRVNWDYVTKQEETDTAGYPSTVKNYGFGDSYVYPLDYLHNSGFFGLGIMIMHNDYITVKCSPIDSQQAVYAVLVNNLAANDTAFSYGLGSLAYKSPSDYEWASIYLAIPSNQSTTNTTVTVTFTFNHYEMPQWVYFGVGVVLSSLAVISIFKSNSKPRPIVKEDSSQAERVHGSLRHS